MNRIKFFMAAVAALFIAVGAGAQDVNAVIDKYNQAAEVLQAKDYEKALSLLNEVVAEGLEAGPDAAEVVSNAQKLMPACYFRIGLVKAKDLKWDEAIDSFTKASEMGELYGDITSMRNANTMIARAYTAMGADAFNDKDYAKAAEIFAKGYEANPNDTALALNLAMSYCEMGDTEQGFKIYNRIMSLPADKYKDAIDEAKTKIGYYQSIEVSKAIEAQDYDKAFEMMDAILAENAANPVISMMYIQTATNQKQWDKVIAKGEAAAAAQSSDELRSDAYFLLGAAYQNKENKAKAIENYRKVTAGGNVATAKAQIAALSK